jgi:DNA-binding transcriptional ArsR family regulator
VAERPTSRLLRFAFPWVALSVTFEYVPKLADGHPVPHHLNPIAPEAVAEARAALPSLELCTVAEALGVLADPARARILYALGQRPHCAGDLAIASGVSESAVSHQLRLPRERPVVKARREGAMMYYPVNDQHVAALIRDAEYHADRVRQGLPDHIPSPPAEGIHREGR